MLVIKWTLGYFSEDGNSYLSRTNNKYYLADDITSDIVIWNKPHNMPLRNDFIWLPIVLWTNKEEE